MCPKRLCYTRPKSAHRCQAITTVLPANKDSLEHAANILLEGGVVCIPTDTVYGIAGIATNSIAVSKVFEVKQRDPTTPPVSYTHLTLPTKA